MRRAVAAAAVATVAALSLAGCGGAEESPTAETTAVTESPAEAEPTESPTEATTEAATEPATDEPEAIEIEIEGDRIEPNGRRVEVESGETVTFDVESDRAAELHVHSSPEQVLEVEPGESTLTLVVERPGIVDIEEHDTGLVVVQLEVR